MANTISRAGDGGSYKSSPKPKSEPAPKQRSEPAPKQRSEPAPKEPAQKKETPVKEAPSSRQTPIRAAEVEAPKKATPAPKPEPPAKVAPISKPTPVRADQDLHVKAPIVAKPEATVKATPTPTATRVEDKPTEKKSAESTDHSREKSRVEGMGYIPPMNNSAPVNNVATNQSSTKVAKDTSAIVTPVHKPQALEESQSTKPVAREVYVSSKISKENDPITKDVKVVNNNNTKVQTYTANTGTNGKTYEKARYDQYDEAALNSIRNYNQNGQTKPIVNRSQNIATPKSLGTTERRNGIQMVNTEGISYSYRTETGNQAVNVIKLGDEAANFYKSQLGYGLFRTGLFEVQSPRFSVIPIINSDESLSSSNNNKKEEIKKPNQLTNKDIDKMSNNQLLDLIQNNSNAYAKASKEEKEIFHKQADLARAKLLEHNPDDPLVKAYILSYGYNKGYADIRGDIIPLTEKDVKKALNIYDLGKDDVFIIALIPKQQKNNCNMQEAQYFIKSPYDGEFYPAKFNIQAGQPIPMNPDKFYNSKSTVTIKIYDNMNPEEKQFYESYNKTMKDAGADPSIACGVASGFGVAINGINTGAIPAQGVAKAIDFDVSNKVWKEIGKKNIKGLDEKFKSAIEKGIVGPQGQEGIKKLNGFKYKGVSYEYEVKILGKGVGDFRIYGNKNANGVIEFTTFGTHK